MKVIFLDIDGVLVWAGQPDQSMTTFDPAKVSILNRILDLSGAYVVLSSTWRYPPDWDKTLVKNGIPKERILGRTPVLHARPRIEEINAWLTEHPTIERWAILDDDTDAFDERFPEMAFRTYWDTGLTDKIASDIVFYLELGTRPPVEEVSRKAGDICPSCNKGVLRSVKSPAEFTRAQYEILECPELLCRMGICSG